jgi:hypothetical protein
VSISSFEPTMLLAILPEILLLVLAGCVVALDAIWKPEQRRILGWLTAGGVALILVVSLLAARPAPEARLVFGGMLRQDWFGLLSSCWSCLVQPLRRCLRWMSECWPARRILCLDAGFDAGDVPDGFVGRLDHALSVHRNYLDPALYPGRLHDAR